MSIEPSASAPPRAALLGHCPVSAPRSEGGAVGHGTPRVPVAQRDQLELQTCDLDALLASITVTGDDQIGATTSVIFAPRIALHQDATG